MKEMVIGMGGCSVKMTMKWRVLKIKYPHLMAHDLFQEDTSHINDTLLFRVLVHGVWPPLWLLHSPPQWQQTCDLGGETLSS